MLIVWDKLFGTVEPESEPVRVGLAHDIDTFNPARIAFHEWQALARDLRAGTTWRERLGYVLAGPGWQAPDQRRDGEPSDAVMPIEIYHRG